MNGEDIHEDADLYCLGTAKRIFAGSDADHPSMGGGNNYPGLSGDGALGISEKLNNQRTDKPTWECPPKPSQRVYCRRDPQNNRNSAPALSGNHGLTHLETTAAVSARSCATQLRSLSTSLPF